MYASCVDKGLIQCAPIPDEFAVSLTIGKGEPEVTFYADRSDVLKMFDNTARVVKKQPIENAGCFKLTEVLTPCAGDKLPAALKLDTFAKMMISETRH